MEFSPKDVKLFKGLGQSEVGRELTDFFERAKAHYSSIQGIDTAKDAAAQVEGRRLFAKFIDEVIDQINSKQRKMQPIEYEDFT